MAEASTSSTTMASQSLPPGMVIGPDGKPCKICTSSRDWRRFTKVKKVVNQDGTKSGNSTAAAAAAAPVAAVAVATQAAQDEITPRPENCPPDVEQLGRATWTFLHTTAAYYPEKPTPNQRANMLSLLRSLPVLYPCSWCATHLGENMKANPPDVSGRLGLSRWLCERHNEVNDRLGKPRFDCSWSKLDERWKDGPADGSCD
ncbi:ERV/ALR sulfhydryl oxidase domain-containing protein [Irpex rosettiformis]|uniref:ERV/ALR sulfhydryl oxidase domain-containing protein n=1 Tax=Irpex rosettiformis TaxID=378272 RepID=A0ACB8TPB3_9APHY|nr:ERV/ALR sulfhydryl oxidase domain-containing protein [Irpex rosettiformis]